MDTRRHCYPIPLIGVSQIQADMYGCNSMIPDLKLIVGSRIDKSVNFVVVCNSPVDCPNFSINDAYNYLNRANDILNRAGVYLNMQRFSPRRGIRI